MVSISDVDPGSCASTVARHTPDVPGWMYMGSQCTSCKLQVGHIILSGMNAVLKSRVVHLLFGAELILP